MRVRDGDAAAGQQAANLNQLVDHGLIGLTRLAVFFDDAKPCKEGQISAETAVIQNIIGHLKPMLEADLIVIIPVTWRGMHETRARIIGDMVACKKFDLKIPFAIRALSPIQRVMGDKRGQFIGADVTQARVVARLKTHRAKRILGQFISYKIAITNLGPTFVRGRGDLIEPIGNRRAKTNRAVLRNRPRGGCPDHDKSTTKRARILHLERHPNRIGLAVVIFHFRLGQCGLFNGRPHHGLRALVKRAVHQEFHKLARDHRLGVEIHGEVWLVPIPCYAKALELRALHINPPFGKAAAFLTKIDNVNFILILAFGAIGLLNLPFDGQAVTIPTRNVARLMAHHLLAAHNHILQHFVQCVTDMQITIGIGGAIMQHEWWAWRACLSRLCRLVAQALINANFLPTGQPIRLALWQACAHREISLGKVQRVFIVGKIGTHGKDVLLAETGHGRP